MEWGVATVVSPNENRAAADLTTAGFNTYFPRFLAIESLRGQMVERKRPLFPGYLFFSFIGIPLAHAWRMLFNVERIKGVLMCADEQPARLPGEVIDELRERESVDGVIRFEKKPRRFKPGAPVRITKGVMVGFNGLVDRLETKDRISVLFDMFGRQTTVSLRETEVTAA